MKEQPEIVPDNLKNPISYKIVLLIISLAVFIYLIFTVLDDNYVGNMAFVFSVSLASSVSLSSFLIAKRYWNTKVFGKSYLSFSFAYASYAIAEVLYYTFELILEIPAYPSVADIFFFALYPLTLIHLILNIKFFITSISTKAKLWMVLLPMLFIVIYSLISLETFEDAEFDFYYGIIFVGAASITLAFAVYGMSIFRKGLLGVAWLLLVIGVLINTIGDLWYYQLEVYGFYTDTHPVTIMWFASNMLMIYALYKHQKII